MSRVCSIRRMAATILIAALATAARSESAEYVLSARIPGPGGAWDYAVVDEFDSRFYLAQGGVTALDLESRVLTSALVHGGMTHGLAPLGDGSVAVADATTRAITVFNGRTGKITARIETAKANPVTGVHALDALVLEPNTGLLAAVNGEAGLVLLADRESQSVVGTISIGGKPEFAAASISMWNVMDRRRSWRWTRRRARSSHTFRCATAMAQPGSRMTATLRC